MAEETHIDETTKKINELRARLNELFELSKAVTQRLKDKACEARAHREILRMRGQGVPRASQVRKHIEELEFKIATEALKLNTERALMREIKAAREQLAKSEEIDAIYHKLGLVESDIAKAERERTNIETDIQNTKGELDRLFAELRVVRAEKAAVERAERKRRQEAERAEKRAALREERKRQREERMLAELKAAGIGTGPIDDTVTLGDIAVLKVKKPAGA